MDRLQTEGALVAAHAAFGFDALEAAVPGAVVAGTPRRSPHAPRFSNGKASGLRLCRHTIDGYTE